MSHQSIYFYFLLSLNLNLDLKMDVETFNWNDNLDILFENQILNTDFSLFPNSTYNTESTSSNLIQNQNVDLDSFLNNFEDQSVKYLIF